jgi:hypothetical protein
MRGRVGRDLDADGNKTAAREVAVTMLATLIANLGSPDRVKRVIKVLGMVNCTGDFETRAISLAYAIRDVSCERGFARVSQ